MTRPFFSSLLIFALAATAMLATGCDEQQILYEADSPEPIPAVPGLEDEAPHAPGLMMAAPARQDALPSRPDSMALDDGDAGEPMRQLDTAGLTVPVPLRWRSTDSPSAMRIAQFEVLPHENMMPSPSGEFVVFYFGQDQGGTAESNAERWLNQFIAEEGRASPLVRYQRAISNGLTITRVTLEGRWAPTAMGPGAPDPEALDGWAMDALVVEGGPAGSLFYRLTGPAPLVSGEDAAIQHIARSVRISGSAGHAPAEHDHDTHDHDDEPELALVEAPGLQIAIPATWEATPTESQMRQLQFRLPGESPDADGELAVFYFGRDGGGPVEDNLHRWANQVRRPDGQPSVEAATIERTQINGFDVSSVYIEGTYAPIAMGPMMPTPEPREGHALMGIIVEGGDAGPVYLRFTGPVETIAANRGGIALMLNSLRRP